MKILVFYKPKNGIMPFHNNLVFKCVYLKDNSLRFSSGKKPVAMTTQTKNNKRETHLFLGMPGCIPIYTRGPALSTPKETAVPITAVICD